jgi:CRP-like cAMP-binding protein
MFIKLKYVNGTHPGSAKEFSQPNIKIGRAPNCDFALYDSTGRHSIASRVHAEMRCENNELALHDLNSSNGSFVNGERIKSAVLKNGDILSFGPDGLALQVNFLISSKDDAEFLSCCPLFADLPAEVLYEITRRGDIKQFPVGDYLFRIGEECSNLYVIYSGLVELSAVRDNNGKLSVIGFLSSGESLGESLALIEGKYRSEARIKEAAEIFTLSAESLAELIQTLPDFALRFSIALCNKLSASEGQLQSRHSTRHLQGDLQHFDLATIIQTLNGLRDTGVLSLYPKIDNESGVVSGVMSMPPFARIYFEAGEVRYMKLGSRSGEEGFNQLFQMPLAGNFSFGQQDLPEDMAETEPIHNATMNLLLEAHRLQDELENLKLKLPDLNVVFKPQAKELNWKDDVKRPFADQIWQHINKTASLCEILAKTDCCNFTTYSILLEMFHSGQIRDDKSPPELVSAQSTIRMSALNKD